MERIAKVMMKQSFVGESPMRQCELKVAITAFGSEALILNQRR